MSTRQLCLCLCRSLDSFPTIVQEFGPGVGSITPINFLESAYKHQIRMLNFPKGFPFPKFNTSSQRGWKAHHTYDLLEPRLIGIRREIAEQMGEVNPDDPHNPEEDKAYYFERWTEGMLLSSYI